MLPETKGNLLGVPGLLAGVPVHRHHGYRQPYAAGGDLVAFYFVANGFGIPETNQADYAFFGACMIILVLGELLLAAVSLRRFFIIESHK
jgi:hypothetical protein